MTISIADIIRTRLNDLHMSQMALSLDTGVAADTICLIETGKVSDPHVSTVVKLIEALGLKPEVTEA